jgi:Domain of unknown function (DUF4365)
VQKSYPRRPQSHQLEEASERAIRTALPRNWIAEKPLHDYGVDLRIDIFDGDAATGLELLVQLKASAKASPGDYETLRIRTATFNHLASKLQVVMLVKYVDEKKEAYWSLLKNVNHPSADRQTFIVHIPKANRFSTIDWAQIQAHVYQVTNAKLAATRRKNLERSRAGKR